MDVVKTCPKLPWMNRNHQSFFSYHEVFPQISSTYDHSVERKGLPPSAMLKPNYSALECIQINRTHSPDIVPLLLFVAIFEAWN
jgi:hypothetical protein